MLMLDRYLVAGGRALDLATGATIRWQVRRRRAAESAPLFTARGRSWLIDFDLRGPSRIEVWERISGPMPPDSVDDTVGAFRTALVDARDGRPRALDIPPCEPPVWTRTHRVLAREARLAGFVPLAADAFGAVLAQAHWRWPSWLKERALVVFAMDSRLSPDATLALFRLATKDARPHLIVRSVTAAWQPRLIAAATHVHEGAPTDALVDAPGLAARADSLAASGKWVDAEAAARWSLLLSAEDQPPSRCALARSLIGQRRLLEARAALDAIDTPEAADLRSRLGAHAAVPRLEPAIVDAFLEILRTCQDHDDPAAALVRVTARLNEALAASAVAIVICDRDRPHAIAHAGAFVPTGAQLQGAARVLDTGVPETADAHARPAESAWPIRYGATIVGALWCHWSMGLALIAQDVAAILGVAAIAAAPSVHEMRERLRGPAATAALIPDLVGESSAMAAVRQAVVRAAASPFPVLIEGESGAGKEVVARAIHAASVRRGRRFCALNCAAIADDLVESELFGHTRGAFTGAVAERLGLFEEAQGGTLFLDEVAELSARVQAKLLRTLQEGEVRRVGESGTRKVDARIVAATNRPLIAEVNAGRFRNDLRYRLDVLRITIPPLRERLEDLPPLVHHAWSQLAARTGSRAVLSPAAVAVLGSYDWPGNVRELQNVLASVMVSAPPRGIIGPNGLPAHITRARAVSARATLADARRDFEARYVRAALARAGGRCGVAARELGISRQGLTKLATRLGVARYDATGGTD